MNYPQIMSPVPFAFKSEGSCPPAPMGAPPMVTSIPMLFLTSVSTALCVYCDTFIDPIVVAYD